MRSEVSVLWDIHDKARRVKAELRNGLRKASADHPNKFSLEAKRSMAELAGLIHESFNLKNLVGMELLPTKYQQVANGLTEATGLKDRIVRYRPDDSLRWLLHFCTDLQCLASCTNNHRDNIRRAYRICCALEGECDMACVVSENVDAKDGIDAIKRVCGETL
jgi:hypothetical protein